MRKKDAIAHFGSGAELARALEISRQAVDQWPEIVPFKAAIEIQRISGDKLMVNLTLYRRRKRATA